MKRICSIVTIIIFLNAILGCAYLPTKNMSYKPISVTVDECLKNQGVLVVKDFAEERPPRAYPSLQGHIFKTYIPLLPYVKVPYERLDESDAMTQERHLSATKNPTKFTSLMPAIIAEDLNALGLFNEVRYIGNDEIPADANFVLTGHLRSSEFDKCFTSYMLGMAGVLLWLLPIPLGSDKATIVCELKLKDISNNEIWSHQLMGKSKRVYTLYNSGGAAISSVYSLEIKRYGKNDNGVDGDSLWAYHASALQTGMYIAKQSLVQTFKERKTA